MTPLIDRARFRGANENEVDGGGQCERPYDPPGIPLTHTQPFHRSINQSDIVPGNRRRSRRRFTLHGTPHGRNLYVLMLVNQYTRLHRLSRLTGPGPRWDAFIGRQNVRLQSGWTRTLSIGSKATDAVTKPEQTFSCATPRRPAGTMRRRDAHPYK